MFYTEEKIAKQLSELKPTIHRQVQEISVFKFIEADPEEAYKPEFDDSAWADFKVGESWGGYDIVAWFRTQVPIPQSWKKGKLALRFLVGPRDGGESTAEALLYVGGKPLQGIDVWHEEAWLPEEELTGGSVHVAIRAWSGVLGVPERRRFKLAQLVMIDEDTEQFYYLALNLLKAIQVLEENDLRRTRLLKALNESILQLNWLHPQSDDYYASVSRALAVLNRYKSEWEKLEEWKPTVIGIGHSHIDMAWLWRLHHTRAKASRTFSTVLHLMRQYPEYRFLHTSPQLYKYLKADHPEIYARVKERIDSGQWEITGGMWIEPDTNVPNGESLIRQILYGKRFMKEEFGVDTNVVWLPDVFGYSWALPQIIRKSGIDTFMTTKISWSQYNRFPYDTFHWRGIDGTEILTHFITTPEGGSPFYTYNGMIEPESIKGIWDQYQQKDVNDELLLAYGWGDGGGGPTMDMLEAARALQNVPGLPKLELGKVEPYFERLTKRLENKRLPVWDGELYLEFHRGTYTSQGWIKRANRKAEILYHNAEWLNALADILTDGDEYPEESLTKGWELLLLNQFHDILPGSSIRQVYEDAREQFHEIEQIGVSAVGSAIQKLSESITLEKESIIVFNPLAWHRDGIMELPWSEAWNGRTIMLPDGRPAEVQETAAHGERVVLVYAEQAPALGYRAYPFVERDREAQKSLVVRPDYLENEYLQIRLSEKGQLTSIWDKRAQREVLASGDAGNVLQAFEDRPMKFDAWDIDLYYQEIKMEINVLKEAVVEEEGPLRGVLRLVWTFSDSVITQRLTIYKASARIDFRTVVDWREKQVLLKAAFPVNVRSTRATHDIQFGSMERPTHWNTSWDFARFETCAHKWIDVSEGNYGVSLLNDCKYGHDVKDNVMRITLIKSPVRPDETADRGFHTFTYSLLPHTGGWREADVAKAGYELNVPLLAGSPLKPQSGRVPSELCFVKADADHIVIETMKQAEDGDGWIIRLYENKQFRKAGAALTFGRPIRRAEACNLIEESEGAASWEDFRLTFDIQPFEIKTFRIWF